MSNKYIITGITVCVNFWDLLAITIHKWSEFCNKLIVITDKNRSGKPGNFKYPENADEYTTDVFYERGASFNKGAAIEELLHKIKIKDYVVFFDSDILLPDNITLPCLMVGKLYTPYRKIVPIEYASRIEEIPKKDFLVQNEQDFSGYFQLFHSDSLPMPWYTTYWKHAGGYDSEFQNKFNTNNKVRLDFHVYHIGEPYINWYGRAQKYTDGTITDREINNLKKQMDMLKLRYENNNFENEVI